MSQREMDSPHVSPGSAVDGAETPVAAPALSPPPDLFVLLPSLWQKCDACASTLPSPGVSRAARAPAESLMPNSASQRKSTHTFPSHPHIKVFTLSVCLRRRFQMSRHHVLMCLMKHGWKGTRRMMCFPPHPHFFFFWSKQASA